MLSGSDSLKRNRGRSVSVSLFSCHLVSQSPMSGEGGGVCVSVVSMLSVRCLGVV